MTEFYAALAALQRRLSQLEATDQALYAELDQLRRDHETLRADYNDLVKHHNDLLEDHELLSKDFLEARKKLLRYLEEHREEILELAVIAGNTAAHVFPKLDSALREIDEKLGIAPDAEWRPPSKKSQSQA